MSRSSHSRVWLTVLVLASVLVMNVSVESQEKDQDDEATAIAPPNMTTFGSARGGAYFVDRDLHDRYEAIKDRLAKVRDDIAQGNATGADAIKTLTQIDEESKRLREELDENKVLVSAFQVFSKTTEQTFDLAESGLVILTSDSVIVRGWEGPGIKCVLEKSIIAKEQPAD